MARLNGRLFLVILLAVSSAASADSEKTFEVLKSFKGRWTIQSKGKTIPVEMSYDEVSKGSAVSEQFGKELSVFYMDGNSLLMTHFCNVGNQPRLKLKDNKDQKRFEFEMLDITNLKNAEFPHVEKVIYNIIDNKHFELELVWKKKNEFESEKYSLTQL